MTHLAMDEWNQAPPELQRVLAMWCIKNGFHRGGRGYHVRAALRRPYLLILGVRELVEYLVADGCTRSMRCLVDFPDVDPQSIMPELWAAVLRRFEAGRP